MNEGKGYITDTAPMQLLRSNSEQGTKHVHSGTMEDTF